MPAVVRTHSESCADLPRLAPRLRAALSRLLALDMLFRERRMMASLDPRMLRDIGVTRADVDQALNRPHEHLRSILVRSLHEL